jgi:hypothetical protein
VTTKQPWPNPRLQRTPAAPLSRKPLGAAVKSAGRACGESLVSGVRGHALLRPGRLPQHRPGPVGFWFGEQVEQQTQWGVSST